MAELPTTTPLEAAPERDRLLATKLHAPRPRPGFLARPQLLERVAQGTALELTLVCAPAGFGKTSLLGEWVRHSQRPVAWLSLDQGDSDPVRFWRYVSAALDCLQPGIHEQVAGLLQGPRQSLEVLTTAVANELATRSDEVVLVLDDYHLVETPAVHDSLTMLLERLPAQLRVVLASRADPPLPMGRLRARGQLTEVRAADLRFSAEEAAELLRTVVGAELPEAAVTVLGDRTEGWVAGLQLAALSLRGHDDVAAFVEGFSGSHRFVLDYLTEEVLDRQPEPLRTFLLETSILERLSGELCDAVRGRGDSQELLERAERANLFLHPLDEVRGWWRYHHLFADLLRARLQQADPGRVRELHRAAAAWHEAHGLADEAIRHALAADDADWAARLIERHVEVQILRRNEGHTLDWWLNALPPEVIRRCPRLSLGQAVTALLGGRLNEVEPLLAAAEQAFDATGAEPYEPSIGRAASILANIPAVLGVARADLARQRGQAEREAAFARAALANVTDEDQLLGSIARYHLAVADWMEGRLEQAERALTQIVAERAVAGERHMAIRAGYDLGHVQQARGRLGAAVATYRRGLEVAGTYPQMPSAGMAEVGLAEVLYERDELEASLEHATAGVALCRQLAFAPPLASGLFTLARIRQAQGDPAGAMEAIEQAGVAMPDDQVVDLLNPAPTMRARLALAAGEVAATEAWIRGHDLTAEDEPSYPREHEHLILARVLLAGPAPEQALGLLERLGDLAVAQGRTGSVIEIRALQALAHAACGDEQRALAALAEALTLGAPEGYLRIFVDEGPAMAGLLRKRLGSQRPGRAGVTDAVPRGYLARLAAAFQRRDLPVLPPIRRGAVAVPGLVEPLSAREVEVLELLAAGQPNRAIADELVITLDTVKRHVSHILDKLQATNRTQAVTRARQLGLVR